MMTMVLTAGHAMAQEAAPEFGLLDLDTTQLEEQYEPAADVGLNIVAADPGLTTKIPAPVSLQRKLRYIGASYYGTKGCQQLATYYGFQSAAYWGPYIIPTYFQPGYYYGSLWIHGHWVPAHSLTYCYGIKG